MPTHMKAGINRGVRVYLRASGLRAACERATRVAIERERTGENCRSACARMGATFAAWSRAGYILGSY